MHRLPHTWDALFSRFGRFTEIQAQAIDPLLAGKNCILISATASGKTEAALAPLLERQIEQVQSLKSEVRSRKAMPGTSDLGLRTSGLVGPRTLFIVPTRALTRDMARRLEQPMHKLGVHMRIKTGDEPALTSSRPAALLLTTPESFDSLLANRPRMLKDVCAVVLDEIHLYDNTARGDQVRILLNRLRRIKSYAYARGEAANAEVQFCALSATISDPAGVAARYFTDPQVVSVGGHRALDAEVLRLEDADSLRMLFADLQRRGCRKVLAFCERRAECEELAHRFSQGTPFGDRVFVHHASLDRGLRRRAEREFAQAEAALCFATSTLELGIDIGDVDLVVLIGPPDDVSSFLQRTGRGNRRTSRTHVVCFYRNATEQALFQIFIRAAINDTANPSSTLDVDDFDFELQTADRELTFHTSVIVQQLCSYIKQTRFGEIDSEQAFALFHSPDGVPLISPADYRKIIEHLVSRNYFVVARGSTLRPARKWQELYEQRGIYTNLTDTQRTSLDVIDEITGRRLGEVGRHALRPGAARTFLLAGHARRQVVRQGRRLIVRSSDEAAPTMLPSCAVRRSMRPWLARRLAIELGLPIPNPTTGMTMLVARTISDKGQVHNPGTAVEDCRELLEGGKQAWLLHCAGELYAVVLGDLLEDLYEVEVVARTELHLALSGALPASVTLQFTYEQVRAYVLKRWREFEGWFDLGSFQSELPPEIRRANVTAAFNIPQFLRFISGHKVTLTDDSC